MADSPIDIETGEIIEGAEVKGGVPALPDAPIYAGLSTRPLSKEETEELMAEIPTDQLDILPTGEVYAAQIVYRRKLNKAFGAMGWGLRPISPLMLKDNVMYREYALYCHGQCVSQAVGEADYQPDNARMSYATAAEAVKSNALMRCCKDLGIAAQCWDRRFTEKFKAEHCEQYTNEKGKRVWRLRKVTKERTDADAVTREELRELAARARAVLGKDRGDKWLITNYDSRTLTFGQFKEALAKLRDEYDHRQADEKEYVVGEEG